MLKNKDNWNKVIIASFLGVPILASIISTLHIIHFFMLGNPTWMSYFLAITFEVGSIASFVALSVMDRIKKGLVLFIFIILFLMQVVGNIYFSFEYVNQQLAVQGGWMGNFIELIKPIYTADDPNTYKFILAMVIGIPIPLVSLSFLKSLVDYLKPNEPKTVVMSAVPVPVEEPANSANNNNDNIAPFAGIDR